MLYRLLEEKVVPLFYERDEEGIPKGWVAMVRASMARLTPRYSSARMMQEYVEKIYRPAAIAYRKRSADGARLAEELAAWQERLNENWKDLRFGRLTTARRAISGAFLWRLIWESCIRMMCEWSFMPILCPRLEKRRGQRQGQVKVKSSTLCRAPQKRS